MIGGDLSGEQMGLYWLEEAICELASFHCLSILRDKWSSFDPYYPLNYVDDYIHDMLQVGSPAAPLPLQGYIEAHQEELYTPFYRRDLYAHIALALYPCYLQQPELWSLLPYFGNLKKYYHPSAWLEEVKQHTPSHLHHFVSELEELFLAPH